MLKKPNTVLLIYFIILSVLIQVIRMLFTSTSFFLFLNWNLLLALVPLAISTSIIKLNITNKFFLVLCGTLWLLFLPNAPYLITDLLHAKERTIIPLWYDVMMLSSYAITGLLAGLISVRHFEMMLSKFFQKKYVNLIIAVLFLLCSLGVYLGRFLRWNSWDFLHRPMHICEDVLQIFASSDVAHFLSFNLIFGMMLNMSFISFKYLRRRIQA